MTRKYGKQIELMKYQHLILINWQILYIYIYICVCVCVCVYIYIYIYIIELTWLVKPVKMEKRGNT